MGKFLGVLATIALVIFIIMKWGGLIVGIIGTIIAIIIGVFFVGGGDA